MLKRNNKKEPKKNYYLIYWTHRTQRHYNNMKEKYELLLRPFLGELLIL